MHCLKCSHFFSDLGLRGTPFDTDLGALAQSLLSWAKLCLKAPKHSSEGQIWRKIYSAYSQEFKGEEFKGEELKSFHEFPVTLFGILKNKKNPKTLA